MTEEQWQKLYENYETRWLLGAVDHIDKLRSHLADGEHWQPPQIRTDMLHMHGIAMDVVNNGWDSRIKELAAQAVDLEDQVTDMMNSLEAIQLALQRLIVLLPPDAFDDDD